jgi:phasin protein
MMSTDENTPIRATGKNGKTELPAKKASKRSRKPAQQVAPEPEPVEQPQEPTIVAAAVMENLPADVMPDVAPDAPTPVDASTPIAPKQHTENASVSLQSITNAYGDFTRKSIEQTSSFFEQLAGVRSIDKAFELQGEFAKQTFETFVSESRRIRELHSELTMQRFRSLEGFVARMKPTRST